MTQKKLYVIILSFFTIIIGVVCFSLGNYFDTNSLATEKLKTQTSALEENTSSLTDTKNDLESQINDLNSELSTKTTVNNYFMEAKKKNDKLKNDITELNQKSSELDSQIEELQNQNSSLQTTEKTGKTYTLKKDQSYTCPSEIPAGRYIATGTGTLVIYSSGGKARVSEDLAVAYNNSYSFTLSEKEKIKATDDIKLTEIKSNCVSQGISNPSLIVKWVNDFRIAGPDALRPKKKGRKKTLDIRECKKPSKYDGEKPVDTSAEHVKELEDELLKLRIENAYLKELRRLRLEEETLLKKQRELSTVSEDSSN
ncbi:MAG: helix-turn-helix domain-containing protein [Eubacteriales bacterium]